MSIFGIDEEMIMSTIARSLEDAGSQVSEEQFGNIVDQINESFPGIIELLTTSTQENWQAEARATGGHGVKYANAIKSDVSDNEGIIYVDEDMIDKTSNKPSKMFVSIIENGTGSWSIKDALMKSDKAKIGKDGIKYMTIPLPVSTPRKANQGKMSSHFGGREMSKEAYKIVKNGGKFKGGLKSGTGLGGSPLQPFG